MAIASLLYTCTYTVIPKKVVQMKRLQYYNKVSDVIHYNSLCFQFLRAELRVDTSAITFSSHNAVYFCISNWNSTRGNWIHNESRDFIVVLSFHLDNLFENDCMCILQAFESVFSRWMLWQLHLRPQRFLGRLLFFKPGVGVIALSLRCQKIRMIRLEFCTISMLYNLSRRVSVFHIFDQR